MEKIKLSIKLKNRLTDLTKIKKAVLKMSDSIECTRRKSHELGLVLEELFTNIVNHGFSDDQEHDIYLSVSCADKLLKIRLEDDGKPFDITAAENPDTECVLEKRCVGGLGIHFIKHFIDECSYSRENGKNIVVLKKNMAHDIKRNKDDESIKSNSVKDIANGNFPGK